MADNPVDQAQDERGASVPEAPADYDVWIYTDEGRGYLLNYLKDKQTGLDALELLPTRAYNILTFSGNTQLWQIVFLLPGELMQIPRMDAASAADIARYSRQYLRDLREEVMDHLDA